MNIWIIIKKSVETRLHEVVCFSHRWGTRVSLIFFSSFTTSYQHLWYVNESRNTWEPESIAGVQGRAAAYTSRLLRLLRTRLLTLIIKHRSLEANMTMWRMKVLERWRRWNLCNTWEGRIWGTLKRTNITLHYGKTCGTFWSTERISNLWNTWESQIYGILKGVEHRWRPLNVETLKGEHEHWRR